MKPAFTKAEMIRRLREMASQILSPGSEGKRFFNAVADELDCVGTNSEKRNIPDAPEILARIQDYLGNGGLFNPEMMEHDKVRDLLMDCQTTPELVGG